MNFNATINMLLRNFVEKFGLLLLIFMIGCESAQQTSSVLDSSNYSLESPHPKIIFESTEHNFGKVASGSKNTCFFDFVNDGDQDLIIKNIHASCGCTNTTASNMTVKPGQSSDISVTYQAGSSGKTQKQVTVYTNDPENPKVSLWISAEVIGSPKSSKSAVSDDSPSPGKPIKQQPKDTMSPRLKQTLRNLNRATGG